MSYLLGIDEAGYGPNLGPFVMSLASIEVKEPCDRNLWKVLQAAVRKASQKPDGRLIVDDSKQIYSPKSGLSVLEKNLWPFIYSTCLLPPLPASLQWLWKFLCVCPTESVDHEPYIHWDTALPMCSAPVSSTVLLSGVMRSVGVHLCKLQTSIISPRHFNVLTREANSKAAVPLYSIGQLLSQSVPKDEIVDIYIDRLGGRQRYFDQVSRWFPEHEVIVDFETQKQSRYRVGERIAISFQVEADQHSFPVALASMLSKYWRELLMMQFNAWFAKEQPGVTTTAGYPLDATRFWNDVEPTRKRLGLSNDDWWRER